MVWDAAAPTAAPSSPSGMVCVLHCGQHDSALDGAAAGPGARARPSPSAKGRALAPFPAVLPLRFFDDRGPAPSRPERPQPTRAGRRAVRPPVLSFPLAPPCSPGLFFPFVTLSRSEVPTPGWAVAPPSTRRSERYKPHARLAAVRLWRTMSLVGLEPGAAAWAGTGPPLGERCETLAVEKKPDDRFALRISMSPVAFRPLSIWKYGALGRSTC